MSQLNLSLGDILGSSKYDYIEQVILPELKVLVKDKKLSDSEWRKIQYLIKEKGIDVLLPKAKILDVITLNTAQDDGYLIDAKLKLTDYITINNIIKKFSSAENFERGVNNQKKVHTELENTKYDGIVPKPTFVNKKQRLLVTPYVDGGTLKERLDKETSQEKLDTLKTVIDDYVNVFTHLNQDDIKSALNFPKGLSDFNEFFRDKYETFDHRLFAENIGNDLNAARKNLIHGDFHVKNIIMNGKQVYIDWANAASNGFFEFDLGKLLTKADVDYETEMRLVEHAASKLYSTEKERKESVDRYTKSQIAQELLSAKRYVGRSEDAQTKEDSDRLSNIALVLYNTVTRRTRVAAKNGVVSSEFLEAVLNNAPKGLVEIDNYESLKKEFNPHILMSQENIESTATSLTDMVLESPDKAFKRIEGSLFMNKVLDLTFKYAPTVALTGFLALGAGWFIDNSQLTANVKVAQAERWQDFTTRTFYEDYEETFSEVTQHIVDGKVTEMLPRDSPKIQEVADKYENLDAQLLSKIMEVNRVIAGIERTSNSSKIPIQDVNLLDPFSMDHYTYYNEYGFDMNNNLEYGAERLSKLIKKYDGNVQYAVYDFFDPFEKDTLDNDDDNLEWIHGNHYSEDKITGIRAELRNITYAVMNGLSTAYDGGVFSKWITYAPDDFVASFEDFKKIDQEAMANEKKAEELSKTLNWRIEQLRVQD
ncbi:MAG: phosphotransferase [archaeon]